MVVLRRRGRTPRKTNLVESEDHAQQLPNSPEGGEKKKEKKIQGGKKRDPTFNGTEAVVERGGKEDEGKKLTELITASDRVFSTALANKLAERSKPAKSPELIPITLDSLEHIFLSRRLKKAIAGDFLTCDNDTEEDGEDEDPTGEEVGSDDNVSDAESQDETASLETPLDDMKTSTLMMSVLSLPFEGKMLTPATQGSTEPLDPKTGEPIRTDFYNQFTKVTNGVICLTDDAKKASDPTANRNKGWGIQLKRNSSLTSPSATNLIAKLGGVHQKKVSSLSNKTNAKLRRQARPDTAGKGWFNMPAQEMTREVKQDLRMLANRSVLDPKRFYKKDNRKTLPS